MRCRAIAETTQERCRRPAVKGMDVCSMHTQHPWNPRLDNQATISRREIEALLGDQDHLPVRWLTVLLYRRIRMIETSNLAFLDKVERSLALEDMVLRLVAIRRVLDLSSEAAGLLEALEKDDDEEQLRRLAQGWAVKPPNLPLS